MQIKQQSCSFPLFFVSSVTNDIYNLQSDFFPLRISTVDSRTIRIVCTVNRSNRYTWLCFILSNDYWTRMYLEMFTICIASMLWNILWKFSSRMSTYHRISTINLSTK